MANDNLIIGLVIFVFVGAFSAGLIIMSVVVADWAETRDYKTRTCSGNIIHFDPESGGLCAHGTATTWIVENNGTNITNIKEVELFYPPIKHWLLVCKKTGDVKQWAAGLSSAQTIECLIDDPDSANPIGITVVFDEIGGYIAGLIMFGLILTGGLLYVLYVILDEWDCCVSSRY